MNISFLFLFAIALLILVLGIVAMTSITLVAKKGKPKPDNNPPIEDDGIDPWIEAGKRTNSENDDSL
jgi:hypothetical protein